MALPNNVGSPVPTAQAAHTRNQRTPSAQSPQKRNLRTRKHNAPSAVALDGAISDSAANPSGPARPSVQPKQAHSASTGSDPVRNGRSGNAHPHKQRPVSGAGHAFPATPAKEQAYAGPTFQASPAPSSLPVPRFFSKSVPNVAQQPSLQGRMDGEKTPERSSASPGPDIVAAASPRAAQQSPLDIFFNAHKAEQEKSRSNSGLLSPNLAARPRPPMTEPRGPAQQAGKGVFLRELDGDSDDSLSARTVPSRRAAPPFERSHSSPGTPQSPQDQAQKDAYTKSLKELLFNSVNTAPQEAPFMQTRAQSSANAAFPSLPPTQRSSSGPATPAPLEDQHRTRSGLHYGNRNLSPLFKAARDDTPSRPSNLRQELASEHGETNVPRHIDSDSFSRDFLDQHVTGARHGSHTSRQQPLFSSTNGAPATAIQSTPALVQCVPQHGAQSAGPASTGMMHPTTGAKDIKTMEDDLRRMLKLNVLG